MIALPKTFPFTQLKLREGETVRWVGFNPTFHRFRVCGLVITDISFLVCSPAGSLQSGDDTA